MLPKDVPSEWEEPTSDVDGLVLRSHGREGQDGRFRSCHPEEVKRNRTLPNDETPSQMLRGAASAMAKMREIQEFSVWLAEDFSEHDYGGPFVPSVLPRVLELQFEKPPEGKSCPMLPWKFGQKVDY